MENDRLEEEPQSPGNETRDAGLPPPETAERARNRERERRRLDLLRGRRRFHFARAALIGFLAGGIALLFQWALYGGEQARTALLRWLHPYPLWGWLVLPLVSAGLSALAGWLMTRYAPETSGSGIPHVKAVLLHLRPLRWGRMLPVKFVGGVLGISAGLSLGREGPTVQMGAAIGQAVSHWLRRPRRLESHLIACGAGAGLSAAFNAPLAGFIFVIEELQRELSPITYGTALIAAVCADIITRAFNGQLPSFRITGYPTPSLTALPLIVLVGALAGAMGVAFNRGLLGCLKAFHLWPSVPVWVRTAGVGAVAGLVAWWLPEAIGGGHLTAEHILRGEHLTLGFVLTLFAAKFALTLLSYGSGAPGGIFAPLLVLGALQGLLVGQVAALWFPALAQTPAAFAMIGMGAYFTAIVRAPLTGIILITEMTGNYEQLFALSVACLTAYVVAEHLRDKPIYEALLDYDLHRSGTRAVTAEEPVLMDLVVEPGSTMDGRQVRDLGLPSGCLLVTLKRAGHEMVPGGDTRLQKGDEITVIVAGDVIHSLAQMQDGARSSH